MESIFEKLTQLTQMEYLLLTVCFTIIIFSMTIYSLTKEKRNSQKQLTAM